MRFTPKLALGPLAAMLISASLMASPASADDKLPPSLFAPLAPAGDVRNIPAIKQSATKGDTVVLRGWIGGAKSPIDDRIAEFRLVDAAIAQPPAASGGLERWQAPGVNPESIAVNAATIRILEGGHPLARSLRGVGGLEPGREVVIAGKVHEPGESLVVEAQQIYVKDGPLSLPEAFIVSDLPSNAKPVQDWKGDAKPGDTIALRGRIGGSKKPMLDGRAMFTIIGPGPKACNEIPGDKCAFPWDYCCEPRASLTAHAATVQVLGPDGKTLPVGLKGVAGIKELSDLVVVGKVARADKSGVLVVNATGIHIVKP